jgi:aspartate aminotransferase
MLNALRPQGADKILQLMEQFRADKRAHKIDLGVGVYKDATGLTPVMRAVKVAERRIWETQNTKTYTGLAGEPEFNQAMAAMILGGTVADARISSIATPGGTGAIRQALELIRMAAPDVTVWVSDPTWPNHVSVLNFLGIKVQQYRYFDTESRGVDFGGMMADLDQGLRPGDVVLLHGCCHNPTGANLTLPEWAEVAALLGRTGAVPMIDLAYQGFGDGLDADAAGTRLIASHLPEVLVAASCSKNFGIYRERTGVLMALSDPALREVTQGNLTFLNRQTYSFPPDHGARIVTTILNDPALKADWMQELDDIRQGMLGLRDQLAQALRDLSGSDRFGFLAQHRGMFSRLGATPEQVERLRAEHGIYMVGDSRLNIAGLNRNTVPTVARAILAVGI